MPILPLPVFEADADPRRRAPTDAEIDERLQPPKSIVVRFGVMKLIGEFVYEGDAKPGCGTKLVARTHRGTELVEMLTTTCENAGCSKSVSRQEVREYIENSGGKEYPFHTNGRVIRVATIEDINRQSAIQSERAGITARCKELIRTHGLDMKLVEVEPILGGELLTLYYMSEDRIDFRALVRDLANEYKARIEMRQVGARDEARLVADYERCGQYCCCKGFLKVLKPVSMKSAKTQKATLDPLKISGRCGRLMCCLRYEDQTYKELKANLPRRGTRVGTDEGPGVVVDGKILVQLVLVKLDADAREIAVPVEELLDPETCPRTAAAALERLRDPLRGMPAEEIEERVAGGESPPQRRKRRRRRRGEKGATGTPEDRERPPGGKPPPGQRDEGRPAAAGGGAPEAPRGEGDAAPGKRRRRRRRRRRGHGGGDAAPGAPPGEGDS